MALLVATVSAARLIAVEPPARVLQVATDSLTIDLALNPTTGQVFALGSGGRLTVIDEVARHASVIALPSDSFALTVDSSANRVYASSFTYAVGGGIGEMTIVDPQTGQTDFILASSPGVPTANSSTHRVYVTRPDYVYHSGFGFHAIFVIDGATLAVYRIQISGSRSVALAVDELHDRIYVAAMGDLNEFSDVLTIVDGLTEQTTDVTLGCPRGFPGATGADNVASDPGANQAWITCYGDSRVLLINGSSLAVSTYPVGGTPTQLAVNSATGKLYVALNGRASLVEIDPELRTVQEIPLAGPATALAVNPRTDTIYVVHPSGSTITLIDGDSHTALEAEVGPGASRVVVDASRDIAWVATSAGVTGLYGFAAPCFRCTRVVTRLPN